MIRSAIYSRIKKIKPIVDALLILQAFLVSFLIRFSGAVPSFNFTSLKRFWPFLIFAGLFSLWVVGGYEDRRRKTSELFWLIGLSVLLTVFFSTGFLYLMGSYSLPRSVLLLYCFIATILLFTWHAFLSGIHEVKRVLIIGDEEETGFLAPKFQSFVGNESFQIVDVITAKDLPLSSQKVRDVDLICISASVPIDLREKIMIDALQWNVELYIIPRLYEIMLQGAEASRLDDSMYFKVKPLGLDPVQRVIKRTFDIILAVLGLILSGWLFPIIGLAIRLDSPGPVFYSQVRVGRDNRLFKVHKFRTMVNDAERLTGPVLASANDSRITRVGRFLRKTRLDEIPQLWNVLKGEMSFVGPRPERPSFVQEFSRNNPIYAYRMKVKPGITGLAQVEGNYSTDYRDKLAYDLMYIRNYSVFLDLQIIASTILVVLRPGKAEGVQTAVLDYQRSLQESAPTGDN